MEPQPHNDCRYCTHCETYYIEAIGETCRCEAPPSPLIAQGDPPARHPEPAGCGRNGAKLHLMPIG